MGKWGIGWLSEDIAKYEAIKEANLKKIAELTAENAEIDAKIAELKESK